MEPDTIRECLTGPIPSVCTPFNEDGSIDFEGLGRQLEFDIAAGAKTLLLTAGDSHYTCLSEGEIAEVTKFTCKQADGRVMVVAADYQYSTPQAVEFAKFARDAGADVVMTLPPDWGPSCTPETLAEHYATVAEHLPVMIVTNIFIPRGADFGLETIRLSLEKSSGIVAIKDDMCGDFARRLCLLAHERCAVFAGGQKVNHLNMWLYGCDGYLSSFLSFAPDVAWKYWRAVEKKDIDSARAVIRDFDIPFFDCIIKTIGNWNAGLHGTLELFGIAKRWRRKPYYSLNDAEMNKLREFFDRKDLL